MYKDCCMCYWNRAIAFPWVSVVVKIVQYFLFIFLLKIQTLLCNVSSLVLVLDFLLSVWRVPPTEWQLLPALFSFAIWRLLELSLAYLVGCEKVMWLNMATVLNQASALTSSIKRCYLFFLICFKVRKQDFHPGRWASPYPLFKHLWESIVFLWFCCHFTASCHN